MLFTDFGMETPQTLALLADSNRTDKGQRLSLALNKSTFNIITFAMQWKREHYSSITSYGSQRCRYIDEDRNVYAQH